MGIFFHILSQAFFNRSGKPSEKIHLIPTMSQAWVNWIHNNGYIHECKYKKCAFSSHIDRNMIINKA